MTTQIIKDTFLNTYKDDYKDSDNYYKILFNNARSLQQRELNQMQSILTNDIAQNSQFIFSQGQASQGGVLTVLNKVNFIKLDATSGTTIDSLTNPTTDLVGIVFTESDTGVKFRVGKVDVATGSTKATLYGAYVDANNATGEADDGIKITDGKTLTGTDGTTLTSFSGGGTADPTKGFGTIATINSGKFYLDGHFVFAPEQSLTLSQYTSTYTGTVGFRVTEEIVTSADDNELFDNSGATLNTASPGADRHKITLTFIDEADISAGDYFIKQGSIENGKIAFAGAGGGGQKVAELNGLLATYRREESGDYVVRRSFIDFETNADSDQKFDLTIGDGKAYINGHRYHQRAPVTVTELKPRTTATINNGVAIPAFGNYVVATNFNSKTITDKISTFATITLKNAVTWGSTSIGTARIKAIEPFGAKWKVYLMDIQMVVGYNFGATKSMGVSATDYFNVEQTNGVAEMKDVRNNNLFFDLPKERPASLTDITLTTQRIVAGTTDASGNVTLAQSLIGGSGNTYTDTSNWVCNIDSDGTSRAPTYTLNSGGATTTVALGSDGGSTAIAVAVFAQKTATPASKTLTSTTSTIAPATVDGVANSVPLGHADVYEVTVIKDATAAGNDISDRYDLDNGQRDNFYDAGKLILKGGKTAPSGNVYVEFKYFAHGTGDFFSVDSYTGQIAYHLIPTHRQANGDIIQLRDVLDFRSRMDNTGNNFTGTGKKVIPLPRNNDSITLDETYYQGQAGTIFLNQSGFCGIYLGDPSDNPRFSTKADTPGYMKIATVNINPYMLDDEDLSIDYVDHPRFTMKDIGDIEHRLDELEEVVAMNQLELATSTLDVLDSSGANRLKSGITADDFKNHAFSDTTLPDYRAAIDPARNELRPEFEAKPIELLYSADSSTNTVLVGDKVMLTYGHAVWKNQSTASRAVPLNPFDIQIITGDIEMSPTSDAWYDDVTLPDKIVKGDTLLDKSQTKQFNSWDFNWSGVKAEDVKDYKEGHVFASKTKLGGTYSSGGSTTAAGQQTTNTYQKSSTQSHYISKISSVQEKIGDTKVNLVSKPYMRSRFVSFRATGLRPNTEYFAFFDGKNVDDWVNTETGVGGFVRFSSLERGNPYLDVGTKFRTATQYPSALGGPTTNKRTDANGAISGYFLIPHTSSIKFKSGKKVFQLQDTSKFSKQGEDTTFTSFAKFFFLSEGTIRESQSEYLETRTYQLASGTVDDSSLISTKVTEFEPSCFMPHALVTMADGTEKPISEIVVGDQVKSPTREGKFNTVMEIETPQLGDRLVYGWNGKEPFVSEEHPLWMGPDVGWGAFNPTTLFEREFTTFAQVVREELKDVSELRSGSELITLNGTETISDLVPVELHPHTTLYNLLLDGDNTYFCEGYVAHNKCGVQVDGTKCPGAPGGECFIPEALVLMSDGSRKEIQHVEIGDKLMGWKGDVNTVVDTPTFTLGTNKIHGFNGKDPFVTSMHPIMTNKGWASFDPEAYRKDWSEDYDLVASENEDGIIHELKEGDSVAWKIGTDDVVYQSMDNLTTRSENPDFKVYNLTLDGDHTFVVEDIVVHNKEGCFIGTTQIEMADYSMKNIIDVKIGDRVFNWDRSQINTVMWVERVPNNPWKELYSPSADHEPFATTNHPMYMGNTLAVVDTEEVENKYPWLGKMKKWVQPNVIKSDVNVYNLWVDGDGTFTVNGFGTTSIIGDGGFVRSAAVNGLLEEKHVQNALMYFQGTKRRSYGAYIINKAMTDVNSRLLANMIKSKTGLKVLGIGASMLGSVLCLKKPKIKLGKTLRTKVEEV